MSTHPGGTGPASAPRPRREEPARIASAAGASPSSRSERGRDGWDTLAPVGVYAAVPGPASPELVRRGDEVLALAALERPPSARSPRPWVALIPDDEAARALGRAQAVVERVEARLRLDAQRARARAAWEATRRPNV